MQERSEPEKADNGIQMRTNLKNGCGLNIMTNDDPWWPIDQWKPMMTIWSMIIDDDQLTNNN